MTPFDFIELKSQCFNFFHANSYYLFAILFIIFYCLYLKKFKVFIYKQSLCEQYYSERKYNPSLPAFPYGWFRFCDSDELRKGQTQVFSYFGEKIAVSRTRDNQLMAFDAQTPDPSTLPRKWLVKEHIHQIFVWYHPREELRLKPLFELFDHFDFGYMEYRGYSQNIIRNHISEILENTVDYVHFNYVHSQFKSSPMKYHYDMKWRLATDPDLFEHLTHEDKFQDYKRTELLSKLITEKNKEYVQVNGLESTMKLPEIGFKYHFLTGTAFHLGPNLIYYMFNSPYYNVMFFMAGTPIEKFVQKFTVTVFTNRNMPYFVSAPLLYGEMLQMTQDGELWDSKKNHKKLCYNQYGPYDRMFIRWRNYYPKFFDGSFEKEKSNQEQDKVEVKMVNYYS